MLLYSCTLDCLVTCVSHPCPSVTYVKFKKKKKFMRTLYNAVFVPMLKQGTSEIVANFGFAIQALITDLEYIIEA